MLSALLASACGTGASPPACPDPQTGRGEACVTAAGCEAGELALEGGGCQPAGIPPDSCGQGFQSDGRGGCIGILPAAPCPPGLLAVPGDAECRPVAPCGNGSW